MNTTGRHLCRLLRTLGYRTPRHVTASCRSSSRLLVTLSTKQYSSNIQNSSEKISTTTDDVLQGNNDIEEVTTDDVQEDVDEVQEISDIHDGIQRLIEEDEYELTESKEEEDDENDPFSPKALAAALVKRTDASIDYGSIYWEDKPFAERTLLGDEIKGRLVWEEQDCTTSFPASPEAANIDLLHYMEQRDMWRRRQVLHIPKFCVGSIVAVTYADRHSEEGVMRFVGLCIHINRFRHNTKHLFVLRNVINDEALEIRYPFYSPVIHKIEVLRHQKWENEMPAVGLRFLRDFPAEYSTVDEKMVAEPYTEEPSLRAWTDEDAKKLEEYWRANYAARHPPCTIEKTKHLISYVTPRPFQERKFLKKKLGWRMLPLMERWADTGTHGKSGQWGNR